MVVKADSIVVSELQALPLSKHYFERLGLFGLLQEVVPDDPRDEVPIQSVLCTLILNLLHGNVPLYQMEKHFGAVMDGKGMPIDAAAFLNDDRCGRALDRFFQADRRTFMTELALRAINSFELELLRIHNDTTSITMHGAYSREDLDAILIKHGYNKDHRSDLKQLVFGLNTTADGHVPISFQVYHGNQSDDTTHRPNWMALRGLLDTEDFIYVADCKLCSSDNLAALDRWGGKFITVMPRSWRDHGQFTDRLDSGESIPWQLAYELPGSTKAEQPNVFRTYETKTTEDGYRLIWVHSSHKDQRDKQTRDRGIEKVEASLEELSGKLNSYYHKSHEQIEEAVAAIVKLNDFVEVKIVPHRKTIRKQVSRGRPGSTTKYTTEEQITYSLTWERCPEAISKAERKDGVFPLVTNTTNSKHSAADILRNYKEQPFLENRFHGLKSILGVVPMHLKLPHRIEAMLNLSFIALMVMSLMEREIRRNMESESVESLPLRPGNGKTTRPTFRVLRDFFSSVHRIEVKGHSIIRAITEVHEQVLRLLSIPVRIYQDLPRHWWDFSFG